MPDDEWRHVLDDMNQAVLDALAVTELSKSMLLALLNNGSGNNTLKNCPNPAHRDKTDR